MPASVVLPSPGGPANSRWSTAWPRRRAASSTIAEVLLQLALADELGERRGRSPASTTSSTSSAGAGLEELVTHGALPSSLRASRSSVGRVAVGRAARAAPRGSRRRRSRARPAPRARRRPPSRRAADRRRPGRASGSDEPVLQLDEQPLGRLLADAGHERQRAEVAAGDDVDEGAPAGGWRGSPAPAPARRRGCRSAPRTSARSSRRGEAVQRLASSRMWWWT